MKYAGHLYWDRYFRDLREAGRDLDWGGQWTDPFGVQLRAAAAHTVLELGCGTGNDAVALAAAGLAVMAIDLSAEAIAQAQAKSGSAVALAVADMAVPLPFADGGFDAVMSNVALHMFGDRVTRSVFAEIGPSSGRVACSCST